MQSQTSSTFSLKTQYKSFITKKSAFFDENVTNTNFDGSLTAKKSTHKNKFMKMITFQEANNNSSQPNNSSQWADKLRQDNAQGSNLSLFKKLNRQNTQNVSLRNNLQTIYESDFSDGDNSFTRNIKAYDSEDQNILATLKKTMGNRQSIEQSRTLQNALEKPSQNVCISLNENYLINKEETEFDTKNSPTNRNTIVSYNTGSEGFSNATNRITQSLKFDYDMENTRKLKDSSPKSTDVNSDYFPMRILIKCYNTIFSRQGSGVKVSDKKGDEVIKIEKDDFKPEFVEEKKSLKKLKVFTELKA